MFVRSKEVAIYAKYLSLDSHKYSYYTALMAFKLSLIDLEKLKTKDLFPCHLSTMFLFSRSLSISPCSLRAGRVQRGYVNIQVKP